MTGILNNEGKMNLSASIKLPRLSNIELLRIISMLLILVVHADFWSLGAPDLSDFKNAPSNALLRTLIESISIVSVNVFVMISGWFGIKPNLRSLSNFVFQCAFFLIGIYAVMILVGKASLTPMGVLGSLCLTHWNWFIKAYIGLYILSPLINAFLEKATKRQLKLFLIFFYVFQTVWGWLTNASAFVVDGYSTFSFIGLYVLARYLKLYGAAIAKQGLAIYTASVILNCAVFYISLRTPHIRGVYAYANPLVIAGATGLLLWFSQLNIPINRTINFIGRSCFAVFLLHSNPNIGEPVYKRFIVETYNSFSGIYAGGGMLLIIITFFTTAIVIDQIRLFLWNKLCARIPDIKY